MIPAVHPYRAVYNTSTRAPGNTSPLDHPVSAPGEDGTPFVAGQSGLVPAWDRPGV